MTRLGIVRLLLGAALFGVLAVACGSARAIHPTLVSIEKKDGKVTYHYKIVIEKGVRVTGKGSAPNPDFFTVYNFVGLVKGSATSPRGWTFSTQDDGITPLRGGKALINPVDTPNVPNVTWSYTGKRSLRGPRIIGGFSVQTTAPNTITGEYGVQVTRRMGSAAKKAGRLTKEARIGSIQVPSMKDMKEQKKQKKDEKKGKEKNQDNDE